VRLSLWAESRRVQATNSSHRPVLLDLVHERTAMTRAPKLLRNFLSFETSDGTVFSFSGHLNDGSISAFTQSRGLCCGRMGKWWNNVSRKIIFVMSFAFFLSYFQNSKRGGCARSDPGLLKKLHPDPGQLIHSSLIVNLIGKQYVGEKIAMLHLLKYLNFY
jgi:hypothetical protein